MRNVTIAEIWTCAETLKLCIMKSKTGLLYVMIIMVIIIVHTIYHLGLPSVLLFKTFISLFNSHDQLLVAKFVAS